MKKILFLIATILLFCVSYSQTTRTFPSGWNVQPIGGPNTVTKTGGIVYPVYGFASAVWSDTTAMNNSPMNIKNIMMFRASTVDGKNWIRAVALNVWLEELNSSSSGAGTVTSVAALTLGTTGTDLSSSVANGTTTPVITLNVPTASASNRGALSAADWITFNAKQSALTFTSPLVNTAGMVAVGGLSGVGSNGQIITSTGSGWAYSSTLPAGLAVRKVYAPFVVSNDSISQRYNVLAYGATGDGVTNDRAAIQAAINAAAAAKYGTVYLPAGTYIADSLYIPLNTSGWAAVEIVGESNPATLFGTIGSIAMPTNGSIIKTSSTTNTVLFQTSNAGDFSYTHVILRNLDIRTYDSTLISAVDMGWAYQLSMYNCYVNTNTYNVLSKLPKVGTYGIITPKNNNGAFTYLSGVIVTGFDIGIDVHEHTYGDYIVVASNRIGLQFETANQPSYFGRVGAYRNSYNIAANGVHYFTIAQLNCERPGAGQTTASTAWQNRVFDLSDPSTLLRGSITWSQTLGGSGQENSFTKDGGLYIITNRITNTVLAPFKILAIQDAPSWLMGGALTYSTGSGLGINASTGIGTSNQATIEISTGTSTATDSYYADIIQASDQTGTSNLIGRNIWVNKQSGDADKRLAQTYVSTNGATDAGIYNLSVNNGTALTSVLDMDATNFKAYNVTSGVGTKALRYNPGTGKFTYADTATASGGTPAGSDREIQFNNAGVFGASVDLTYPSTAVVSVGASGGSGDIRSYQVAGSYVSLKTNTGTNKSGLFRSNTDFFVYYNTSTGDTHLDATFATSKLRFDIEGVEKWRIGNGGGLTNTAGDPAAWLHLKAGTTTVSPFKFTSGTLLTTAEAGAVEFLTDKFYGTITTGAARKEFVLTGNSVGGRILQAQGADVASAAGAIALGTDGNSFEITGTAAITLISNTGWVNGSEVTLLFTSTASLTDGTANSGTDIGMELAGNANFSASAGAIITLVLSEIGGTQRWREKNRSVN